jgi:regulator of CtrA degradation
MHNIAWLLHQRAILAGERGASSKDSAATLGDVLASDPTLCALFDPSVQKVVLESERLFERVQRLDSQWRDSRRRAPVQAMFSELEARL